MYLHFLIIHLFLQIYKYRFVNINHKQTKTLKYVKLNTHYPLKN